MAHVRHYCYLFSFPDGHVVDILSAGSTSQATGAVGVRANPGDLVAEIRG